MPTDERSLFTEREWRVRCVRNFFFEGVSREVGDILSVDPWVARSMIEAGNVIAVSWPKQQTDNPYALQNVTPAPASPGAGVTSINGIEGDISFLAGPNITITTGPTSITVGAPNVVPTSRQVIAGAGLSGGGALTGNITLTANVTSVFGRTGAITAQAGDYNAGQITLSPTVNTWTTVQQAITALAATPPGMWQSAASPAGAIYYTGGFVGIGTQNPTETLTVSTTTPGDGIRINRFAASGEANLYLHHARGTQASPQPVQAGDYLGYVGFGGQVAGNAPSYAADGARIEVICTAVSANNLAGDLVISTSDGTVIPERVRITSLGLTQVSGIGANPSGGNERHGPLRVVAAQHDCRLILDTVENPGYSAIAFYYGGDLDTVGPSTGTYMGEIGADPDGMLFYSQSGASTSIWIAPNGNLWLGPTPSLTPSTHTVHVQGSYEGPAALVQATAPANPQVGQLWWDSVNIRLMIWNGAWIQAG